MFMHKPHAVTKHASIGPELRKVSETTSDQKTPRRLTYISQHAVAVWFACCFNASRSAPQARQSTHVCCPLAKYENKHTYTHNRYMPHQRWLLAARLSHVCQTYKNCACLWTVPRNNSSIHEAIREDILGPSPIHQESWEADKRRQVKGRVKRILLGWNTNPDRYQRHQGP